MALLSFKRQNTVNNSFITSTHRIQMYSSQWRNQIKMGLFLFGHQGHTRTQQHSQHHSLQKANTQRPISKLGQQPLHNSHTHCLQHTSTQGQGTFQQPNILKELEHIRMALHCCHFPTWALKNSNKTSGVGIITTMKPPQLTTKTPTTTKMGPITTATTTTTFSYR